MATTILFQTPTGGTNITSAAGTVQLTSLDISDRQNLRAVFAAGSRGLTFTVKTFSAASGQNSDLEAFTDTITVPANGRTNRLYANIVSRRLKVTVRLTTGTTPGPAMLIVMGN